MECLGNDNLCIASRGLITGWRLVTGWRLITNWGWVASWSWVTIWLRLV